MLNDSHLISQSRIHLDSSHTIVKALYNQRTLQYKVITHIVAASSDRLAFAFCQDFMKRVGVRCEQPDGVGRKSPQTLRRSLT
jgi:hypothetical protein